MLGILLNAFKNLNKSLANLVKFIDFGPSYFGVNTSYDYDLGSTIYNPIHGSELADVANNQTLSFNNLTIPEGHTLMSDSYSERGHISSGVYAPLIIRCRGTLKIDGVITATGCGERGDIGTTEPSNYSELDDGRHVSNPGFSATWSLYHQISTYFSNNPFGNFKSFYYGTGGGVHTVVNGISSGASQSGVKAGGGSGGVIVLYFKHLYATLSNGARVEYGVHKNFPVERIHANGVGGDCGNTATYGGGMLIISANIIDIGTAGEISADGTLASGVVQTGTNYSILNNMPQLGNGQQDYYWDSETNAFVYGTPPNRTYYYNNGLNILECNANIPGENNSPILCGGGGIVIGVRTNI